MGELIRVAAASDIPPGTAKIVQAKGEPVAIFNANGKFYALHNTCIHKGGPLGEGFVDEAACTVECPWHGWAYKLETGEKVDDASKKVRTYKVVKKGSDVFVEV